MFIFQHFDERGVALGGILCALAPEPQRAEYERSLNRAFGNMRGSGGPVALLMREQFDVDP